MSHASGGCDLTANQFGSICDVVKGRKAGILECKCQQRKCGKGGEGCTYVVHDRSHMIVTQPGATHRGGTRWVSTNPNGFASTKQRGR